MLYNVLVNRHDGKGYVKANHKPMMKSSVKGALTRLAKEGHQATMVVKNPGTVQGHRNRRSKRLLGGTRWKT